MSMVLGIGVGLPFGLGRGSWSPPQLSDLLFFLRRELAGVTATGTLVDAWASGYGPTVTFTGSGSTRPNTATSPTRIDGATDDRLDWSTPANVGAAMTWMVCIRAISFPAGDRYFYGHGRFQSPAVAKPSFTAGHTAGGSFKSLVFNTFASTGGDSGTTPVGKLTTTDWVVLAIRYDGTGVGNIDRLRMNVIRRNDTAATLPEELSFAGTVPATLVNPGANPACLNALDNLPSAHANCSYSSVAMWDSVLTDAEILSVARQMFPAEIPVVPGVNLCVPLGDSITLATSAYDGSNLGGYRGRVDTAAVAASKLLTYCGTDRSGAIGNDAVAAVGGSKASDHLTYWESTLAAGNAPDLAIVLSGTNDIAAGELATLTGTRWPALFAAIQANASVRKFLVLDLIPRNDAFEADCVTANAWLAAHLGSYSKAVHVTRATLGLTSWSAPNYTDAVHPNATGFALMATGVYSVLGPLL